jgi:hypothetical protein
MRSKNILSIVAFIAAFGLSAAFASLFITKTQIVSDYIPVNEYNSTSCFKYKNNLATANKISALIRQDKRNGRESDRAYYRYGADIFSSSDSSAISGYAGAVEEYVNQSSSMKADDLPSDFQVEWREHMKAWRDYSDFLNRMKKSSNREALSPDELKEIEVFHSREISRTWNEVLQTAVMFGANVY